MFVNQTSQEGVSNACCAPRSQSCCSQPASTSSSPAPFAKGAAYARAFELTGEMERVVWQRSLDGRGRADQSLYVDQVRLATGENALVGLAMVIALFALGQMDWLSSTTFSSMIRSPSSPRFDGMGLMAPGPPG